MTREYWTIYDDDSMDYETVMEDESSLYGISDDLKEAIRQLTLKRLKRKCKEKDHFEKENDLFEMGE